MFDRSHIPDRAAAGRGHASARRALRALTLSLLALAALAFAPPLARSARAEPVHADISADLSGGFARIVFRFSEEIDADVRMANNILVVTFKSQVSTSVDRLSIDARGYVNAARRDPDGLAVRMALGRKVQLHSMMVAERLFVDLLPDGWAGAPPPLPQEVVEELVRRARVAEKKQREQEVLARERQLPLTPVHVAHQPTFSRYTFELSDLMPVTTERDPDKLTVVFGRLLKFDLANAKFPLPPMVKSIDSKPAEQSTAVTFSLIGKVDVRTFREDNAYIVDVLTIDGKPKRGDGIPQAGPAPPRPAAKGGAEADPGIEPPQTVPAQAAAARVAAPVVAAAAPPAPPQAAPAPAAAPPAAQSAPPPVSAPAPAPPAAAAAAPPTMAPAAAAVPPAAPAAPAPSVRDANPPGIAAAAPAAAPPSEARPAKPAMSRAPDAPIVVTVSHIGDHLKLTIPFETPTPAAVFRRADTLWMVFDTAQAIDLKDLTSSTNRMIRGATVASEH